MRVMFSNRTSERGELLGQQTLAGAGLGASTGTTGNTRSRTWGDGQTGGRGNFPVQAVLVVTVMGGAVKMADHHPGDTDRRRTGDIN